MTLRPYSVLDTNVISALAEFDDKSVLGKLIPINGTVFVPYFVLQELLRGAPQNEMRFLAEIGAEHEPLLSDDQLKAISAIEEMQVAFCRILVFGESEGMSYSENLEKHGFGTKNLNNLRPPLIVHKILRRLELVPDGSKTADFFASNSHELGLCDQLALQSLLLSLLGFWRDTLILKSKADLSIKGMMKQYQDAKLIGEAAGCECLVSSDRRLCMIAHAVYEYNSIGTQVVFFRKSNDFEAIHVSEKNWSLLTRQSA